ncbi:amidase [Rhodococcus sp. IEGM 1379]|uniref:amidase n=1 Tax=Rhodococcus sp. IEGM 1379 TaxID=3047086 RepID=UPI0024B6ACDA|nr:amidase [Rhodococcus sp. IEGM 1379]MDI9917522.1 amidase [Rhodococcus sp. IEGM 1379]
MQDLFDNSDMTGLADAIRKRDVSAAEVLEFSLSRFDERNPAVNAVISERRDEARAEVAAGLPDGPLRGIPFVIKDLGVDVAGLPSTNGSRLFADVVASEDSELVKRYRRAGMVIIGKTNSPEFGQNASTEPQLFGPTRNPHRLTHSVGGSSGGSAAAVAAGIVPAGQASDGGGSIRIPAAACGLVGLKPSRGRVPAYPKQALLAGPMSVNHAVTRSVRDSAVLLDVSAGPIPGDPYVIAPPTQQYVDVVGTDPGRLRIGIATVMPSGAAVHSDCSAATLDIAGVLEALGHEVIDKAPEFPFEELMSGLTNLMAVPVAVDINARLAQLGRELRDDDLEPMTRMIYDRANANTAGEYVKALRDLEKAATMLGGYFTDYDLLLTPTLGTVVPPLGLLDTMNPASLWEHGMSFSGMTSPFNVTGQPAISLPLGKDSAGMPVGVQLVAAFGREDLLLQVAAQLEVARPWNTAPVWPPVEG